jgi:hypothetical protein
MLRGKKLPARFAQPNFPLKFSDRDVQTIVSHLPIAEDRKLERLGDILNEWANHDLQKAFWVYPDKNVAQIRLKIIRRVISYAEGLRKALEDFEQFDGKHWLVRALIGQEFSDYRQEEVPQEQRLVDQQALLREVEVAAKEIESGFAKATDQRRNIQSYLLLLDMAAIFEWLTKRAAARGSDDRPSPFDEFVNVLWSVIFRNTHGIQSALKNWAKDTKKFHDRSPVVVNISMRHPDWRLSSTNP